MPDEIRLRKGKTKTLLEASIDAALLAVEVYNKPRTTFRSENFIVLMIIAWTKLFHAYFNCNKIDYFHRNKQGKKELIDKEPKLWELKQCLNKIPDLPVPVKKNLEFFIGLRNKIEHRYIEKGEIDSHIFGECQAMLLNYESTVERLFGSKYSLNESLVFSLQFSTFYPENKQKSTKKILTKAAEDVVQYINTFRDTVSDEIYASQEYSIKIMLIPKISNTNKRDLAVEFYNLDASNQNDIDMYSKITVITKDRMQRVEAVNVDKLKPKDVVEMINKKLPKIKFNLSHHTELWKVFEIRPANGSDNPDSTKSEFCLYDIPHKDYVYTQKWVDFILNLLLEKKIGLNEIHTINIKGEKLKLDDYL